MIVLVGVFLSAIWVGVDAASKGIKRGQGRGLWDMSPLGWFLACLLLWIVAFPAYLVKRSELIAVANREAPAIHVTTDAPRLPMAPGRFCTRCGSRVHPTGTYCPSCGAKTSVDF